MGVRTFHSATGSFKDFGAQFLAACLKQIPALNQDFY